MSHKITLDGSTYEIDEITKELKAKLDALEFTTNKLLELNNMRALMQRAKNSYMKSLKTEIMSMKSGLNLGDD